MQGEQRSADMSQLHQSRLGLVSQAILLLVTVLFIFSDVLGSLWKDKVPVLSRNTHVVMFRIVEIGVALWFPCVLWNCICPEALWVLNPRKILKKAVRKAEPLASPTATGRELEAFLDKQRQAGAGGAQQAAECFICYDAERQDVGPLIHPCACKGDVAAVHHDCLRTWLMESYCNPEAIKCKVCVHVERLTGC